jgi:diacylglycerol kinase
MALPQDRNRNWFSKFGFAISGIQFAIRDQSSFRVHLPCALMVIALGWFLQLDLCSFGVLLICIGMVLAAELLNTSIEYLARAITDQHDENVRRALDVASGAVLVISLIAAIVGSLILLPALWAWYAGSALK